MVAVGQWVSGLLAELIGLGLMCAAAVAALYTGVMIAGKVDRPILGPVAGWACGLLVLFALAIVVVPIDDALTPVRCAGTTDYQACADRD